MARVGLVPWDPRAHCGYLLARHRLAPMVLPSALNRLRELWGPRCNGCHQARQCPSIARSVKQLWRNSC